MKFINEIKAKIYNLQSMKDNSLKKPLGFITYCIVFFVIGWIEIRYNIIGSIGAEKLVKIIFITLLSGFVIGLTIFSIWYTLISLKMKYNWLKDENGKRYYIGTPFKVYYIWILISLILIVAGSLMYYWIVYPVFYY